MWRLLDETVDWATSREQGGSRILDYQGVSFPLADSAADAAAGRLLTLTVAELADRGADLKIVHGKASMAKLFTSETAWRCADRCVQAFGGRGYLRSNVAERFLRELRVDRIWEGTSEIQRLDRRPRARAPRRRADAALIGTRGTPADRSRPAARHPFDRRRRRHRPARLLRRHVLRNLERLGYDGDGLGGQPEARPDPRGRAACPASPSCPARSTPSPSRSRRPGVPDVIDDAAALGCGGAVVVSAGFGEVEAGRELERELSRPRRARPASRSAGRTATGSSTSPAAPASGATRSSALPTGGVAMISQSGNVAVNALGSRRGIGFHTVISTGNQSVCDASDWLGAVSGADGVRSIALFLESDGDGERFARALAGCAERGIGVVVLKVGSSAAGAGAAAAHTGSLAGDQRVFRALIEEAGAAWARDPHELLELARVLAEPRARPDAPPAASPS